MTGARADSQLELCGGRRRLSAPVRPLSPSPCSATAAGRRRRQNAGRVQLSMRRRRPAISALSPWAGRCSTQWWPGGPAAAAHTWRQTSALARRCAACPVTVSGTVLDAAGRGRGARSCRPPSFLRCVPVWARQPTRLLCHGRPGPPSRRRNPVTQHPLRPCEPGCRGRAGEEAFRVRGWARPAAAGLCDGLAGRGAGPGTGRGPPAPCRPILDCLA